VSIYNGIKLLFVSIDLGVDACALEANQIIHVSLSIVSVDHLVAADTDAVVSLIEALILFMSDVFEITADSSVVLGALRLEIRN